jgi:hypothetical protein
MRVHAEGIDMVTFDEALDLQPLVVELAPDAGELLEGRCVARRLEDAAEKAGIIGERGAGLLLDLRNDPVRQISVRAAEIEDELYGLHALLTIFRSMGADPSRASRRCGAGDAA